MTSQLALVESATTKLIRQILGEVGGIWGDVQNVLAEQIRQLVYGIRTYAFDRNLMVVIPRAASILGRYGIRKKVSKRLM